MAGVQDLPSYQPVTPITQPQGTSAGTLPAAPAAQVQADPNYLGMAETAGQLGTGAYLARAPITAVAKGALGLVSKVPGAVAAVPRVGLGVAGLAAQPIGDVLGGALGGVYQSFANPISPLRRDWAADVQANANAQGLLDKVGTAGKAVADAGWNTLKSIPMGVQAAFDNGPAAPATAKPMPVAAQPQVQPHVQGGGVQGDPARDAFMANIAGLSRRDLVELLHTMPSMPHLAPHDQALSAINRMTEDAFQNDWTQAGKIADPKQKLAAQQAAVEMRRKRLEFTTVPGIGTLNPELTQQSQ